MFLAKPEIGVKGYIALKNHNICENLAKWLGHIAQKL